MATTKDVDVAKKVQTASIIARKSRVDMVICYGGGADVLGPTDNVRVGGTRGAEDVCNVGNGVVTDAATDSAIWGSSVSSVGWSTDIPPTMS